MGQRHQIYVKMPKNLGIAGFHHQWLYGMTAIDSLARLLEFYVNSDEYSPLKDSIGYGLIRQAEAIRAVYSTDVKSGYWHYVHNLNLDEEDGKTPSEVIDPRNGDNNDGITIIDLSHGDFRYCFMSLHGLECAEKKVKALKPLTAREYLLSYYPKFMDKLGKVDWRQKDKAVRLPIDQQEFDETLQRILEIESRAKVLTLAEVKKMFPAMFKKGNK